MKRTCILLALIALSKTAVAQISEDTNPLQELGEVLIQGNRLEIPFTESTRDIQIITQEEIASFPVHSVNELLTYVGGVDVRQRGPFGGQADVSIDGGTFEQTLVLLNGIKLIDDQTAHIMMNIPVPVEAIERIEILRGAAARVYGVNALTGAVNIITKKDSQSFVSANLYSGSSFKSKEEGDGSGMYAGGGFQLTGNYGDEKQSHLLSISQDTYNGQRYNTALNNSRFFYNGNYRLHTNHSIQAVAGYIDNRFGANGFYAAPGDKDSEEIDKTSVFSLSSKHRFGAFTLMPRISNRYNKDDYRFYKHDLDLARSVHYTNALMLEMNGSLSTSIGEFGIGWESRLSRINSTNIGKHQRDNHGVYAEYKGRYWDNLIAVVGTYVNYNTDYGWQAYPGLDLAYLIDTNWKASASIGSSQRIPSFTDLYLDQAPGNVGNPEVKPENAWQYEAAIDYTSSGVTAKIGYFYRDISDFIDWTREDPSQPYTPYNLGNNKVHGFYTRVGQEFTWNQNHKLGYRISYNHLKPKMLSADDQQSKYALESLKHQVILGLNYAYRDFSIRIENRYIKRELNAGYDVLDARVNYTWNTILLYADVSNILNSQYKEAGAVPMPPRWFNLGIKYQWN